MAEKEKPMCPIIGANGNIFNILGIASRTLNDNDMADAANEMYSRVTSSGSYEEALAIIMGDISRYSVAQAGCCSILKCL